MINVSNCFRTLKPSHKCIKFIDKTVTTQYTLRLYTYDSCLSYTYQKIYFDSLTLR